MATVDEDLETFRRMLGHWSEPGHYEAYTRIRAALADREETLLRDCETMLSRWPLYEGSGEGIDEYTLAERLRQSGKGGA